MLTKEKRRKKEYHFPIAIVVIVLLFSLVLYNHYHRYQASIELNPNYIYSPSHLENLIQDKIRSTPLDPEFTPSRGLNRLKVVYHHFLTAITQIKPINSLFHFINKNQAFVHECSYLEEGEMNFSIEQNCYPLDITTKELLSKMESDPDLLIIDIRNEKEYLSGHIPGSVSFPLLEMVKPIFTINRWTEMVVVGDSYYQTKIASETMLRMNFQRLHRLIVPVNKLSITLETYDFSAGKQ